MLIFLAATSAVVPACRAVDVSPVLGFLAAGLALGPAGFGMFSDLSVDGKVAPGAHSAAEAGTTRAPSAPQSLRAEKRSLALWPRGSFLRKPGGQAHPTS